jgi:hypothetical protein
MTYTGYKSYPEPETRIGLPFSEYSKLSEDGKDVYNMIYDYCTYASDPQYPRLHIFRVKISKLDPGDRDILIKYFNQDPAIRWNGIPSEPWEYYQNPY